MEKYDAKYGLAYACARRDTHTLTEAGRAPVGAVLQLYYMIWSGSFHLKVRVKDGKRFGGDAEMKTERL